MTTAWYHFSPVLQTRNWGTEVLQNLPKISRLTSCGALIFCHVPKPSAFTTVLWYLPSQVFVAHLFWFRLVVVIWDLGVSITLKISCWQKSIIEIATRVTSFETGNSTRMNECKVFPDAEPKLMVGQPVILKPLHWAGPLIICTLLRVCMMSQRGSPGQPITAPELIRSEFGLRLSWTGAASRSVVLEHP